MRDLQSPGLMWLKAALFVLIGLISCGLILALLPDWRVALLLGLAVWAFCRAYYFAFYVLERYVDPSFRFSGLWSLALYVWRKRGK